MTQVKKNFIYNVLYQVLTIVLPLITVPYVSRKLGANGIGTYSYTYSVMSYFLMFALLGINNYGNRLIAKNKDNKINMSKEFLSLYAFQIITTSIMILLYLIYVSIGNVQYKIIAYIQSIYLVANMFDFNWFFFGLEKFKITITRNILIKIISFIFIIIFIKNEEDIWKYTLILALSVLLSQIALIPILKKNIVKVKIKSKDVKKHIKPVLILFIPCIAISVYKTMDKIMLGNMSNIKEVGFYEQSEKIINIPMGIITALGTVMLPKISNLVANNDKEQVSNYISKSVMFAMFLAFPICFGLLATSKSFIPILLGEEFNRAIIITNLLSITIIFISFANVLRTQYILPNEMDLSYVLSVSAGAVINFIANIIFIPKYGAVGACIGTILAEFLVMFCNIIAVRKQLPIRKYMKSTLPFFVKGFIMFIVTYTVSMIQINKIENLILTTLTGIIIYCLLNEKYINSIIDIKKLIINKKLSIKQKE